MNKYAEIKKIANDFSLTVLENEPLLKYTSFKIGGKCAILIKINSLESCQALIKKCVSDNLNYLIIGNGSNLLINDCFIDRVVILINKEFSEIYLEDDDTIVCQSGTLLSSLCKFAYENSLSGLEFAYGIPGTVGGAVFMNAGAYGGEISQVFLSCKALDLSGKVLTFTLDNSDLSYRHSVFQENGNIILEVRLKLKKEEKSVINELMQKNISARKSKQPMEYPSAGSMFKRPIGYFAAQLIDECGLKGLSVGGAQVSEKHAGFVINKSNATFDDVMNLNDIVMKKVFAEKNVMLECEPRIIRE